MPAGLSPHRAAQVTVYIFKREGIEQEVDGSIGCAPLSKGRSDGQDPGREALIHSEFLNSREKAEPAKVEGIWEDV